LLTEKNAIYNLPGYNMEGIKGLFRRPGDSMLFQEEESMEIKHSSSEKVVLG